MSYHDHRPSQGDPHRARDDGPNDRLLYVFLLGAAAFALMIWVAVAFERNQPAPPPPHILPPVIVKMPERVTPPPSNVVEKINTPDPAPTELRPSVDLPAEAVPVPAQEDTNAEAIPTEPPAAEKLPPAAEPSIHRAGRNTVRRHHHHGQRRLFHHWSGHRHGKPSPAYCERLCEFFKGTARAAGLTR